MSSSLASGWRQTSFLEDSRRPFWRGEGRQSQCFHPHHAAGHSYRWVHQGGNVWFWHGLLRYSGTEGREACSPIDDVLVSKETMQLVWIHRAECSHLASGGYVEYPLFSKWKTWKCFTDILDVSKCTFSIWMIFAWNSISDGNSWDFGKIISSM